MIHVKGNYYIAADTAQFVLQEKSIIQDGANKGKPAYKTLGYYSSVPNALKSLLQIMARKNIVDWDYELSDALTMFRNIEMEMAELFDKFEVHP